MQNQQRLSRNDPLLSGSNSQQVIGTHEVSSTDLLQNSPEYHSLFGVGNDAQSLPNLHSHSTIEIDGTQRLKMKEDRQ